MESDLRGRRRLLVPFGARHGAALIARRRVDLGVALALRLGNGCAAVALRRKLAVHGALDIPRRLDLLDLDAGDTALQTEQT